MRLASYKYKETLGFGIVEGDEVVAIDPQPGRGLSGIKDLLTLAPDQIRAFAANGVRRKLADVQLLPPIPDPAAIIGIGLNTKSHFEETAQLKNRIPGDYPKYPRIFLRTCDSHVGHGSSIVLPSASDKLDYEGEIAVIIGGSGRNVQKRDAQALIGGYACYNDGSVRDFQRHSDQVTPGKNFSGSGSFGPWLVTVDEIPDPQVLTLETRVNGERRQHLVMDDLIFSFAELVSYASQIFHLRPGDVILTGSPAGIGALSGQWLRPGDLLEIESPQIGTLANTITEETGKHEPRSNSAK